MTTREKREWIPGDCESCGFNDGDCHGRCVWDEHLEFDPYEACMIMALRGKKDGNCGYYSYTEEGRM